MFSKLGNGRIELRASRRSSERIVPQGNLTSFICALLERGAKDRPVYAKRYKVKGSGCQTGFVVSHCGMPRLAPAANESVSVCTQSLVEALPLSL
jgi:hypothetical protein